MVPERADVADSDTHDESSAAELTSSRSTPVIILLSTVLALAGGLLMCGMWLGFMAIVFRGDGEVDGAGVGALLFLGVGAAVIVTLVLYVGTGVRMIRRHRPDGARIVPTMLLVSLPLLALLAVVLFNG